MLFKVPSHFKVKPINLFLNSIRANLAIDFQCVTAHYACMFISYGADVICMSYL